MSNTDVFGAPMILTGKRPRSPFGAAPDMTLGDSFTARARDFLDHWLRRLLQPARKQRRIRRTVIELSKLDNHALRDLGLDRSMIISVAEGAEAGLLDRSRRYRR